MDPPPPPAPSPTVSAAPSATQLGYADSVDSSPRSRNTDSWDEPLPAVAGAGSKLRLMCSYGGHIVPRPHDKSLCYVGGDTRIVVAERQSSLVDLSARLSKTLLSGRPFTLKYQLPNEDLDSLISVTTDEDLENMIDEYDRTSSQSSHKSSRLRLFIFPTKPDSASSIGSLLDNSAKSEDWFLNALNGAGVLSRGFSESQSVNCLLGLDDDGVGGSENLGLTRDVDAQAGSFSNSKTGKQGQDVHSVPDSPMLETTSSFGSTSSSPSLTNLPPIRVHVEDGGGGGVRLQDQKVGIEEQFSQMSVAAAQKQDEGFMILSSPPPVPTTAVAAAGVQIGSAVVGGEYQNRVFSDDERSEQGMPVGYLKPPHPQPPQLAQVSAQLQPRPGGLYDLPSPDSVSSDSSMTNAVSRQKPPIYQDPVNQLPSGANRVSANPVDPKFNFSDPNSRSHMVQQLQDSGYVLSTQFEQQQQQPQQQFIHAGPHYIHHHPAGAMPMSSYYPVYPSQPQHHHHPHPQLDPQYSVYFMPPRPTQAYNLSMQQSNLNESATAIPSSRPQAPANATMIPPSAAYNQARNAPPPKPEMAAGVYRTAAASSPLVQVPSSQHQQQYVGFSQIHHPSQSIAPTSAATANYAYEYSDPAHAQLYYTQPLAPTLPPQYQTMTAPAVLLPEAGSQLPTENIKQQIRTSQPQ
ncbi:protein PAL OF QUIRKY [Malania oleifera]|uniref:protein PAL OF QUIRKY n=1 Tax=Malania oleifera TaxID=397392 RepID=UPI0025ADFC71|nr:protein PAL OF QUIRKY [Malania oleifera]